MAPRVVLPIPVGFHQEKRGHADYADEDDVVGPVISRKCPSEHRRDDNDCPVRRLIQPRPPGGRPVDFPAVIITRERDVRRKVSGYPFTYASAVLRALRVDFVFRHGLQISCATVLITGGIRTLVRLAAD
jgi:hypothetical protein